MRPSLRVPDDTLVAEQFGSGFTGFPFLTGLDFAGAGFEPGVGSGTLWMNATFSDEGKIIGVTVPEPSTVGLFAFAAVCE